MKRALSILAAAGLVGVIVPFAGHPASVLQPLTRVHGPVTLLKKGVSTNWGGYVAGSNLDVPVASSVTTVSGSWVVPTLNCSSGDTTYSSSWVGIDGYDNGTVEQTGTEADCSAGNPSYYAWFEMFPAPGYQLNPSLFPVAAGDIITASVEYTGSGNFELTIGSSNAGWTTLNPFVITKKATKAKRTTAEWIVEAPGRSTLTLADFGTLHFSNAQATIGSVTDDFLGFDSDRLTKVGTETATPSPTGGSNFDVTFGNSASSDKAYVAAVTYSFSRKSGGSLTVTIHLIDNLGDPISGALIDATTSAGASNYGASGLTTDVNGAASFVIASPPAGTYHTEVTSVTASQSWDTVTPPNAYKVK